ncbi:MAG: DnaJ domain-containing protein [Candidatus Eremiobacteraeota bacterium]|nr:DnaJ domain-containing protein [Candidatus Eremiobacteraeota bacterium]
MQKDFYRVLGVSPLSSLEDIHKSYRALSKKYHPDVCKEKLLAEEKTKEIVEAYNKLKDMGERKTYDSQKMFRFREFNKKKSKYVERKPGLFDIFTPKAKRPRVVKSVGGKSPVESSFTMGITFVASRKKDSIEAAQEEFKNVTELDPTNPDGHYNLGLTYYLLGDFDKAINTFRKALSLDPKDNDARTMSNILIDPEI